MDNLEEVVQAAQEAAAQRPWDKRLYKTDPEKFEVSAIQDRTREIARLVMIGWSTKAISEFIGIREDQVTAIKQSTIFRRLVDELQEKRDEAAIDYRQDIERLIPEAIDSYERVLAGEEGTPSLRVKVAGEVLDRTGFAPVKHSVVQNVNTRLSLQDIEEIRARAEQARRLRDNSIEVEAVGE